MIKLILLTLLSIILSIIFIPLGIVFSLFKAIFTADNTYILLTYKESVKQLKLFLINIAVTIDEYGNIYIGELLEYLCTYNKNTLFMYSDTTISASLGFIEKHCKFTPFGYGLRNLLNRLFEDNHCLNAYEYLLRYQEVKKTNEFNNHI